MTPAAAVDLVVAHTGHARYRALCDPGHPAYRPGYVPLVMARAAAIVGLAPGVPDPGPPPPGALVIRTYLSAWSGYGQIGEWLGRGLEARGLPCRYLPVSVDSRFLPPPEFVTGRRVTGPGPGPVLQLAVPDTDLPAGVPAVAFTMSESTGLSRRAVANLNRARAVVVPCRWNAENFQAAGVTVPVHVVPLGVAAAEGYTPRPWRGGGPFTFGMAGRMADGGVRKGLNEGMAAFTAAFPRGDEPVRLAVKVLPDDPPALRVPADPRVTVDATTMTTAELAGWYADTDCLFVPSKGEGFGLHTLQAMACGRPVIAANHGGTAEFFDAACGWELDYDLRPAGEFYAGLGDWAVPRPGSMITALRAAAADPGLCRARGAAAARRAQEFTWERTAEKLHAVLSGLGVATTTAAARRAAKPRVALGTRLPKR